MQVSTWAAFHWPRAGNDDIGKRIPYLVPGLFTQSSSWWKQPLLLPSYELLLSASRFLLQGHRSWMPRLSHGGALTAITNGIPIPVTSSQSVKRRWTSVSHVWRNHPSFVRTYLCTFQIPRLSPMRIHYPDFDSLGTVWASSLEKELIAYVFPNQELWSWLPLEIC